MTDQNGSPTSTAPGTGGTPPAGGAAAPAAAPAAPAQPAASGAANATQGHPAPNGTSNVPQNGSQTDPAAGTQGNGTALTAQPAAPAPIEVKLPEGVQVNENLLNAVKASVKDSAGAQALVDAYIKEQQAATERFRAEHEQRKSQWLESLKRDQEVGGDAYAANLQRAQKVLARFGDQDFVQLLNDTGLGNHPAMVRLLHRVGKVISEDTIAGTGPAGSGGKPNEDPFLGIYTTMNKGQ